MHAYEANGLGISDWDAKIYRIFSKKRLLELLKSQKNGLVPTAWWDDPFENFFLKCYAVLEDGARVDFEPLRKGWYGQCWTFRAESDAMWRIYSKERDGIRVSTTIRKLFEPFYDDGDALAVLKFAIGKVEYETREEITRFLAETSFLNVTSGGQIHGMASTLLVKRTEFDHENEVRLLFHDAGKRYTGTEAVLFPFDSASVIDDIIVDPRLNPAEFEAMRQELISAGYSGPIEQSTLYSFDPPVIRIE